MSFHILLLEDDVALARLTKDFLQQEGYVVSLASHSQKAQLLLSQQNIDLLLCDVMLPGQSGFDFVAQIRHSYPGPILFMTAQTQLQHQLTGLGLGAQDYLLKPLDPRLLLAKIQVFLPKQQLKALAETKTKWQQFNLELDKQCRSATLAGQSLPLTSAELKLLQTLLEHFGKIVSRDWLFREQLGRDYDGMDRTIDGRVSRLRKKLQAIDAKWNIVTAWGEGYYLSYENSSAV